ncbi:MAG: DUF1778 domain-containing protein [Gemmatimonadota bacterium]|nr:DUF1778 domain-containing protein [Gemmatimonadota bacterium]
MAALSLSAFLLRAGRAYKRMLERRQQAIQLTKEGQRALIAALLAPPAPVPALVAAMKEYQEQFSPAARVI